MIIGTAGHIDHGKSALVQALTGRAMDPLAEERRRGITVDLHFAPLDLGEGRVAGMVDVPGHEDLIRTMVAGAAGLDLVLLVVAADEGIMPQTREHLAIVEQLRIPAGIPVLTKADLVEPDWLGMVQAEVTDWLAASPVRFAPAIATSAVTGAGLNGLREAIAALGTLRVREREDLFRLPVDRALSLPGVGTVVTGTAWSGTLRVGDAVTLLPGGAEARVRSLERHGEVVSETAPGDRVAAGLAGVDREQVRRGDVLVRKDDPWRASTALDVSVELLPSAPRPLVHHARVRLHLGTVEVLARVQALDPVPPGRGGVVRLALERPLVARGGDRFVLRSYSPVMTIGGGWVLDPMPSPGRPRWPEGITDSTPVARLRSLVSRRPTGLELELVPVVLGVSPREASQVVRSSSLVVGAGHLVTSEAVAAATEAALSLVAGHHRAHPVETGMPLETLRQGLSRKGPAAEIAIDRLVAERRVLVEGGTVRSPEFRPRVAGGDALVDRVVMAIELAGLTPPAAAELEAELKTRGVLDALRLAARDGRVEAVERDRYFSRAALTGFREAVSRVAARGPITPQALRDETGISRKFLIPLLEWSDRTGLTVRAGDARILGRHNGMTAGGA